MAWAQRKYKPGRLIWGISDLVRILQKDRCWIYYRGRPIHPDIVGNWQLATLLRQLQSNELRIALPNIEPANADCEQDFPEVGERA